VRLDPSLGEMAALRIVEACKRANAAEDAAALIG
jgi:hypothetical protein